MLSYERQRLQEKEGLKQQIEKKLAALGDLESQIAYKKEVQGKKLVEIADELGYSYQYIREKHARYKRTYNQRTDTAK